MGEIRRTIGVMQFVVIAHRCTDTNEALASELNGAVDFRPYYALDDEDVYAGAVLELLRLARDRRALELVGA